MLVNESLIYVPFEEKVWAKHSYYKTFNVEPISQHTIETIDQRDNKENGTNPSGY